MVLDACDLYLAGGKRQLFSSQQMNVQMIHRLTGIFAAIDHQPVTGYIHALDFGDLSRGNGMTRYVTLNNGGRFSINVFVWKFGEVADLVKVSKSSFTLKPSEDYKLAFDISIPVSAETKIYSGRVWIFRIPKII